MDFFLKVISLLFHSVDPWGENQELGFDFLNEESEELKELDGNIFTFNSHFKLMFS